MAVFLTGERATASMMINAEESFPKERSQDLLPAPVLAVEHTQQLSHTIFFITINTLATIAIVFLNKM